MNFIKLIEIKISILLITIKIIKKYIYIKIQIIIKKLLINNKTKKIYKHYNKRLELKMVVNNNLKKISFNLQTYKQLILLLSYNF
jgi:hypothetical protein